MQCNDKRSVCLRIGREVVLDETMMIESTISVKTELLSSSEMIESMGTASSDESKESEDGSSALPSGMELDCSSCLLQEQMKEGNYELVSKVAILLFVSIIDLASSNLVF